MTEINIELKGVTPLICNKFGDSAQQKASTGNGLSIIGDKGTPREIAEQKLYVGVHGDLMIPSPNLFRSIIDAGKYFKNGKSKVTTLKTSVMPACLVINELEIPIIHKEPWTVDTRAVRIPSTGGRIQSHRPCFNDWVLRFSVELDTDFMSTKFLREIIDSAGKRIGLGDFRPDTKGPFGKFVVTQWVENSDDDSDQRPIAA